MATAPATIDLGVYSYQSGHGPLPEPERPWPFWAWLRRWGPVVLMAVLVWPLAAAAAAPAPPLAPLWTAPEGVPEIYRVALGEADLYSVTSTDDGPALTAYRLSDGSVRWESPLDVPGGPAWLSGPDQISVALVDGVLLVQSSNPAAFTAAYDAATAELRWTGDGYPEPFRAGLVALYTVGDSLDPYLATTEIRELDSGAVVMSFEDTTEQFAHQVAPDGTLRLVGLDRDGQLTSYDVATGTVRQRMSTSYPERLQASSQNGVAIVDDLVLVSEGAVAAPEVAAYDLATLEPVWTVEARLAGACGPVVCVHTGNLNDRPTELQGLDPVTGAPQWTMDCADAGLSGRCYLHEWVLAPDGRLVVSPQPMDPQPGDPLLHVIVDAVTGRQLTAPTAWEIVAGHDPGLLVRRGEGVPSSGTEYWREEDITPHRVWWARSDPELERVEVLGAVEADWCTPHEPYLVCHTDGEPFEVWRFTP